MLRLIFIALSFSLIHAWKKHSLGFRGVGGAACKFKFQGLQKLYAIPDFAAEIQNSVGEEIYGPIFKAGLFLILSGFVSSLITAYLIVNHSNWNDLVNEFEDAEKTQNVDTSQSLVSQLEKSKDATIELQEIDL
jgi:hypothetical protein